MSTTRLSPWLTLALASAPAWPGSLAAQYNEPPPPAAYALVDVTVVHADGRREAGLTVVVRRGLIEDMGPGLTLPPDAQVLEGDSLWLYPGLVDAEGAAGFEFPTIEVDRSQVRSWAPPRHLQGFTPHRRVVDHLTATGASTKDYRTKGIVAAGVHPGEGLMPGRGTLLLFRKNALTSAELVLTPTLGPVMSFRSGQGVYPGTLFGVIAFHRQNFEDARRVGTLMAEYQRDPSGMTPPAWDPDYAVLREVAGGAPVFFTADSTEDIRRALGLAAEFGFKPVIVGGAGAWRIADRLKTADVPVLVSVNFPEPTRWKPEEKKAAEDVKEGEEKEEAKPEAAQEPKPLDAAELREKEHFENMWANAGRLSAAGVRIALTTGGGKGDLLKGARKAIEHGLPEAAALRAVTATPAALFGAPQLVRIEPKMAATFVVTDGPLFAEKTRIAYTFVEGEVEKGSATRAGGPAEAPVVVLTGEWDVQVSSDQGSMSATMTLKQDGASFSGSLMSEFGRMAVRDGTVSGNDVSFTGVMEMGGQSIELSFSGTAQENEASGTGSSPFGSLSWKATRKSGPGEEVVQ